MKLKTAIISYPKFSSGLTQYSFYLFREMSQTKAGSNVFFICNRHDDYKVSPNIIKVIEKTRLLPYSVFKLLHFLFFKKIQLVHFQSFFKYPILTYILLTILSWSGKKVFFTAHDILPHYQYPWDQFFTKKIYQRADGIIVHSETNKQELLRLIGKVKSIRVIPHPIYDNFIGHEQINKIDAKKRLGLADNQKILLFFGHIDHRKGVDALLKELPVLIKKEQNLRVVFAGRDGFPKGYLQRLISDLNLSDHVLVENRFIDDKEVALYFSAADALILPYLRGTTSGVLKIALAYKTPVIATKVGDIPETIKSYNAGIVIDLPFRKKDIEKIISLLNGTGSKSFYLNYHAMLRQFSWERAAIKTIEYYNV